MTLSSGETFEGKKYEVKKTYDFTALNDYTNKVTDNSGSLLGFTEQKIYNRVQISSGIVDSNTTRYDGLKITNTKSPNNKSNLYLDYYYTSSTVRYGMKPNTNNGKITVTDGSSVACLDYYYNDGDIPETLNLSAYAKAEYNDNETIEFALTLDDTTNGIYYLYKSLTTYSVVEPTLTEATATLTGFADNGLYAYPVYTVTATHDEDGTVSPSLAAGADYTTTDNVMTYTNVTDHVASFTVSYDGLSSSVDVPASVKYLKKHYDLGQLKTYTGTQKSETQTLTGFTPSGTRYTILYGTNNTPSTPNTGEMIPSVTFGSSPYGWVMLPNYGLQVNGVSGKTYDLTISDVANGYAILYHNIGAKTAIAWDASKIEAEDVVAAIDGTITLKCKNKNDTYYAYTWIDVYVPAANYIHTVYDLSSRANYPATVSYKDKLGAIDGFSDATSLTRYTLSTNSVETSLFNVTVKAQYGWVLCEGYGAYFSDDSGTGTFKVTRPMSGQLGILSFKIGDKNNKKKWSEVAEERQYVYAYNDNLAFDAYDKDGKHAANKSWTYTKLDLFTPIANAKQNVNVYQAVGGMGTLVADHPMDFSGDDLKAYTAEIAGSTVTFTRIKRVPAYTPVLVKYKNEETAEPSINFCNAEDADAVSTNALKAGTGAAVATYPDDTHTNFVLTTGNSGASHGFYFANGRTVATNRAYLQADTKIAAAGARLSVMFSDEETTDINAVNREQLTSNGAVYNLQGQRVSNPTKGLFIVNGKKMIVK